MKKLFLTLAMCLSYSAPAFSGGIPVLDVSNLAQSTVTAMESVNQTARLLLQYQTLVQQLENMVRNTLAPAAYFWSTFQETMSLAKKFQTEYDKISSMTDDNFREYMTRFGDLNYYQGADTYNARAWNEERYASLKQSQDANNAVAARCYDGKERDAANRQRLKDLENQAQSSTGQMQALQAANQFLSEACTLLNQAMADNRVLANAVQEHYQEAIRKEAMDAEKDRRMSEHHKEEVKSTSLGFTPDDF